MTIASIDRFRFHVNDPAFEKAITTGTTQPFSGELEIVMNYLGANPHRNRTYVDVGGHIGTTAIPLSLLYTKVLAFEANPENYALLQHNIELNNASRVRAIHAGLSDKAGKLKSVRHSDANSGCFTTQDDPTGEIDCHPLDAYALTDLDFIKIDVEGSELLVLRGAEETILRCRPFVQIEVNGLGATLHGVGATQVHEWLLARGYSLFARKWDDYFYSPQP